MPQDYGFHEDEVFEEPFTCFNEEIVPSKSVTQIYVDPVEGRHISPLMSDCDEIICVRAVHAQLTSYKPGTNIVLWYERLATFYIWIVGWEEGVRLQQQRRQAHFRQLRAWGRVLGEGIGGDILPLPHEGVRLQEDTVEHRF